MASSSSPNHSYKPQFPNGSDTNSIPNTTFVQADPTTFRAIVQSLTGAAVSKPNSVPLKPAFKLRERLPTARKLEIKLNKDGGAATSASALHPLSSSARNHRRENAVVASPVSTLEYAAARGSPRTPAAEEGKRDISEKGFYLHPDPLSTPRGSDPPELLPLFPLHSPRESSHSSSS